MCACDLFSFSLSLSLTHIYTHVNLFVELLSLFTSIIRLSHSVNTSGRPLCLPVSLSAYSEDTICVGLARVGRKDQQIVAGPMKDLLEVDFGGPLHSFVIAGNLHPVEKEFIDFYHVAHKPDEQK